MSRDHAIMPAQEKRLQKRDLDLVRRGLEAARSLEGVAGIRVMHVDDIAHNRDHIRKLFAPVAGEISVIYSTGSSSDALRAYNDLRPDVVLQDIHRPEMDGLTMARLLRQTDPKARVLFLTVDCVAEYVRRAMDLGARGFLSKPPDAEELVFAVRSVSREATEGSFYFGLSDRLFKLHGGFEPGVALEELHGMRQLRDVREGGILGITRWSEPARDICSTDDLNLAKLKALDLSDPMIRVIDVQMLKMMVNVEYLDLPGGVVDNAVIEGLKGLPRLKSLTVGHVWVVSEYR
jgi:CheY-like chemotaxis protein